MLDTHIVKGIHTIFHVHKCLIQNHKGIPSEYYHDRRTILDPFIYTFLREKYLHKLQQFWNSYTVPKKSEKAIVIVERRCHPNFEFCLLNAAYFARGYSIYIFCSKDNFEYIKTICSPHQDSINIVQIFDGFGTPEQGKRDYNQLLMKKSFWESINADYALTIETDTYLLDFIPDSLSDFDYVASKWTWDRDAPGGGGLTFRNVRMMITLCSDNELKNDMQDTFASDGVKKYMYSYPDAQIAKHFFTESDLYSQPIGVHQWWTFLNEDIQLSYATIEKFTTLNIEHT